MPIGKDSIQNRVAKAAAPEAAEAKTETSVDTPAEVKPAPKKRAPAKKKPAAPKAEAPVEAAAEAATEKPAEVVAEPTAAVLANVAPVTVEAVVGHKENAKVKHVQVGQKMPHYLL